MSVWLLLVGLASAADVVGWVSLGEVTAEGYADSVDLARPIKRHLGELRYCYDLALRESPDVSGRIELVVTVAAGTSGSGELRGEVVTTTTTATGEVSALLQRCTEQKPRRWLFPVPSAQTGVLTVPLLYGVDVVPPSSATGAGLVIEPHDTLPYTMVQEALRGTWRAAWLAHAEAVRDGSAPVTEPLEGAVTVVGVERDGARHLELGGVEWTEPPDVAAVERVSEAFGASATVPDGASVFRVAVRLTLQESE